MSLDTLGESSLARWLVAGCFLGAVPVSIVSISVSSIVWDCELGSDQLVHMSAWYRRGDGVRTLVQHPWKGILVHRHMHGTLAFTSRVLCLWLISTRTLVLSLQ